MPVRRKVKVNIAYSFADAEQFDDEFWANAGPQARLAAGWGMVIDYLKVKKSRGNQLRLRRTVQNIKRLRG